MKTSDHTILDDIARTLAGVTSRRAALLALYNAVLVYKLLQGQRPS